MGGTCKYAQCSQMIAVVGWMTTTVEPFRPKLLQIPGRACDTIDFPKPVGSLTQVSFPLNIASNASFCSGLTVCPHIRWTTVSIAPWKEEVEEE